MNIVFSYLGFMLIIAVVKWIVECLLVVWIKSWMEIGCFTQFITLLSTSCLMRLFPKSKKLEIVCYIHNTSRLTYIRCQLCIRFDEVGSIGGFFSFVPKFQLCCCRHSILRMLWIIRISLNNIWWCFSLIVSGDDGWCMVVETLHIIEFYRFVYILWSKTTWLIWSITLIVKCIKFWSVSSIRIFEARHINFYIFLSISVVCATATYYVRRVERTSHWTRNVITGWNHILDNSFCFLISIHF
jgi:hypothetical protein